MMDETDPRQRLLLLWEHWRKAEAAGMDTSDIQHQIQELLEQIRKLSKLKSYPSVRSDRRRSLLPPPRFLQGRTPRGGNRGHRPIIISRGQTTQTSSYWVPPKQSFPRGGSDTHIWREPGLTQTRHERFCEREIPKEPEQDETIEIQRVNISQDTLRDLLFAEFLRLNTGASWLQDPSRVEAGFSLFLESLSSTEKIEKATGFFERMEAREQSQDRAALELANQWITQQPESGMSPMASSIPPQVTQPVFDPAQLPLTEAPFSPLQSVEQTPLNLPGVNPFDPLQEPWLRPLRDPLRDPLAPPGTPTEGYIDPYSGTSEL